MSDKIEALRKNIDEIIKLLTDIPTENMKLSLKNEELKTNLRSSQETIKELEPQV
jgi:regulator of replication initiation timing